MRQKEEEEKQERERKGQKKEEGAGNRAREVEDRGTWGWRRDGDGRVPGKGRIGDEGDGEGPVVEDTKEQVAGLETEDRGGGMKAGAE